MEGEYDKNGEDGGEVEVQGGRRETAATFWTEEGVGAGCSEVDEG